MAVFRAVLCVALVAAPLAHAQAAAASASFSDIMSGINTLVGGTLNDRSAASTASGLSNTLSSVVSGVDSMPAASTASAAAAPAAGATGGFGQLFSSLGSQWSSLSVIKPQPAIPVGLAQAVKGWNLPQFDVGSLSLNPAAFDLSTLYTLLHPTNPSYCTAEQFTPSTVSPAVVLAPALEVKLSTGSCYVKQSTNEIVCKPPALTWQQTPYTSVGAGQSAAVWTDAQCILAHNMTQGSLQVLYTGGEDVQFPSVDAWLSGFSAGTYSLGIAPGSNFIPVNGVFPNAMSISGAASGAPAPEAGAAASAATGANGTTTAAGGGGTMAGGNSTTVGNGGSMASGRRRRAL